MARPLARFLVRNHLPAVGTLVGRPRRHGSIDGEWFKRKKGGTSGGDAEKVAKKGAPLLARPERSRPAGEASKQRAGHLIGVLERAPCPTLLAGLACERVPVGPCAHNQRAALSLGRFGGRRDPLGRVEA
ncbi:unnamed protein product [Amoebophrya sp. A120]|nr:unnamed protein product [Amoebophrya sp. A120]|eukprot:GSA120T00007750001.1